MSFGFSTPLWSAGSRAVHKHLWGALVFLLALLCGCEHPISEENRSLPFEPKSFELSAPTGPLRVLVLGDFGWGGKGQMTLANAIATAHRADPFHFAITVGDNFYNRGVRSVSDPKWQERFETPYAGLRIRFYPTLGNHDYYGDVASQLEYQSPSDSWQMPARQYRFTAGDSEFFALDTMDPNPAQMAWLEESVRSSTARWKIVYGHHPIYSAGKHGDSKELEEQLLPLIRGKAILYVAGHDHDMQHLKPVDGTHFIVSGGGGARLRNPKLGSRSLFGKGVYGFAVLEIHGHHLKVTMHDSSGATIYEVVLDPIDQASYLPASSASEMHFAYR